MTFNEAMAHLRRGFEVKRKNWDVWIFGPAHPTIGEPHDGSMWFQIPERCAVTGCEMLPGILGSEYEDDSYKPTDIDKAATDWQVEK